MPFFCLTILGAVGRPAYAAGASLFLTPASGTYVLNNKFTVAVKVNSGGEVINASEGAISYDTNLLEVSGISKSGSIFTLWTTEPAAAGGSIRFGGGIPRPGYTGTAGHICTITFKAKRAGTAQVRFTNGAVLANDGKGTNILASMGSANFIISPTVTAPEPTKEPSEPTAVSEPEYNKPALTSPSHPDQNAWYRNNRVEFKWDLPAGVTGVSIDFNREPQSDPGPAADGLFGDKAYESVEDGVWYLHLKYKDNKRWGTAAHYRVMVDTKPPLPFDVKLRETGIGEWPKLFFEAKDELSGISQYEIIIGSLETAGYTVPADTHEYTANNLETGEHTAVVKAVDKAGNEMYAKVTFIVNPIEAPVIKNYSVNVKSGDQFFMSGSAIPNAVIIANIDISGKPMIKATTSSDNGGNWFYLNENALEDGRYVAWAAAVNGKGLKSGPSNKVTFVVSPPVFVRIGAIVINYFTVFVSLLFLVVLIIALILYIVGLLRRKLKKETVEIEEVLRRNLSELEGEVETELTNLDKARGTAAYQKEKTKVKERLKGNIVSAEKRILKEIKDVENILK